MTDKENLLIKEMRELLEKRGIRLVYTSRGLFFVGDDVEIDLESIEEEHD